MAMVTPHQVRAALKVAAMSQAPNRNQDSLVSSALTFLRYQAGDAGKIEAAEGQRHQGRPADAGEFQVTEQVAQGVGGGAVVNGLESDEREHDDRAVDAPGADAYFLERSAGG